LFELKILLDSFSIGVILLEMMTVDRVSSADRWSEMIVFLQDSLQQDIVDEWKTSMIKLHTVVVRRTAAALFHLCCSAHYHGHATVSF
jgi:hypothetical protein